MASLEIGLAARGVDVLSDRPEDWGRFGDVSVWWGYASSNCGGRNLLLEAGYVNGSSGDYTMDRLRFVSASWDQLHGRSVAVPTNCPPDRFAALDLAIVPWRDHGRYTLLLGQHPGDAVAPGLGEWDKVIAACEEIGNVRVRPHPLVERSRPLAEDLADARVAVTWSSTAAIEAVLHGVPVVALDPGCMAWPVASHSLDAPLYLGDRRQWAYDLAYRQWTHDELSSGEAWDSIWQAGTDTF